MQPRLPLNTFKKKKMKTIQLYADLSSLSFKGLKAGAAMTLDLPSGFSNHFLQCIRELNAFCKSEAEVKEKDDSLE